MLNSRVEYICLWIFLPAFLTDTLLAFLSHRTIAVCRSLYAYCTAVGLLCQPLPILSFCETWLRRNICALGALYVVPR